MTGSDGLGHICDGQCHKDDGRSSTGHERARKVSRNDGQVKSVTGNVELVTGSVIYTTGRVELVTGSIIYWSGEALKDKNGT